MSEEVLQLKLGFMSNKELAAWAHKSEKYLSDKKRAWCEKNLSKYAEYEDARGGVNITKIIIPVYASKPKKQIEKNLEKYWGTKTFKADTCKNCLDKMRNKLENIEVKEATLYNYTCQVKREMFGIPTRDRYPGYKGRSRFVYCKINSEGEAEPLTREEERLKHQLLDKHFKSREYVDEIEAARRAFKRREITEDEYSEQIKGIIDLELSARWDAFEREFCALIGAECDFRTLLIYDDNVILSAEPKSENEMKFSF